MTDSYTNFDQDLQTADRILLAAENRFEAFGYNKTTMAEIATDVDMSAANLYRFFSSKKAIAEACIRGVIDERISQLKEIVSKQGLSNAEKLEAFIQTSLQVSLQQVSKRPRINELVSLFTNKTSALVSYKFTREIKLISDILQAGNQQGDFSIDDVNKTARAIHTSILLFDVPLYMDLFTPQEFKEMAHHSAQLLLKGILAR